MLKGIEVSLQDMMACRDRRAQVQTTLIAKYQCPVISFCLNIPGPIKTNHEIQELFFDGKEEITSFLSSHFYEIKEEIEFHDITGDELLICVETDASDLKLAMQKIEETHPLGRLFDIDIIQIDGSKLSRKQYRKCLICDCQAQDCARSRKHSIQEMQEKIEELLLQFHSN